MFYEPRQGCPLDKDPFKSLVVPRPIGWITSLNREGRLNLAPFSFFNAVADTPPYVFFSAGTRPEGASKDSWLNVEATGEFVCNLTSWAQRDEMNKTSAPLPHGEDEASAAGLEMLPSKIVKPTRVAGAPAHLECRYWKTVEIPQTGSPYAVVFGEVVGVHIDDAILVEGRVDLGKVEPIARLGYAEYAVVRDIFRMVRPDV
ncbi:MAG: flavin reductase family protein [Rhodovibrionaceae bacterium]|nr:flavin reductase family protein [Rhodovibrionaceae bacterium]